MQKGIFVLEDGFAWEGEVFGAGLEADGEAVFNTAFSGYEEVLTDPSYAGQIVVMAFPHIGNYGITLEDMESAGCHLRGFVVKEASPIFSSWRARQSLHDFLKEKHVFGLSGVDTRAIVKHLRKSGAMRSILSPAPFQKDSLVEKARNSPSMVGAKFVEKVATTSIQHYENHGERVLLYDFGLKQNILRNLLAQNFEVFVLPPFTTYEEALALKPDGVVLSNGPGDPAALSDIIKNMSLIIKLEIPILGICLGHQLLALALGGKTYKLKFGHRGVNHPVKNLETGEVLITSHNHGFAVEEKGLPEDLVVTYRNLYDRTLEGFSHKNFPFSAVQFHPEAAPGPHDASKIFPRFKETVSSCKN